ncbi:MAG: hypothetical protein A3I44_01505 [Candidatus Sungbacteria bacterium RIFCSPLOWO2_02_FULL_51_17]|uniref:Beta-glucosidase n=1 Tax=Candidatus Sungbacteria bacterium RIFCSPHIGHO2_02_FULL_51_29 TaxID=1802273 RepID=A0A1G2KWU0_9BACT|nr:MAG: hypothetical protein A3C16_03370 [Candidatus Sungbacteria bacterium RIFCSPHIGHO2_02_FULL_51_29]OHA12351.1 MAG: hypothetical protein A3I44_01505 [Candidatus Sungbacteria bacterium RIFCSPLOWO2_02_FULL_51_17]
MNNESFYWGAATSSHQVEGNNHNDWSEWEKANADRLANDAQKRQWPRHLSEGSPSPLERSNYVSGRACEHYTRFSEDFDIAKNLGHNAHRLSLEWSRIEPEEGVFNEEAIGHYREVVQALRARGIEPFVTLWHWPLPLWLRDKGGWKNADNVRYFVRYVEKAVSALGPDVTFWITLNEPLVYTKISYLEGRWPPQEKSYISYLRVSRNLIKAHKKAFGVIKRLQPASQVGIAHNMSFFEADKSHVINGFLKWFGEWRKNFGFLNAIADYQDFIGFNYYSSYVVNLNFDKVKTEQTTDMGWAIYPKGIYLMLTRLKKYRKPIYITENGLADAKDEKRAQFIDEHIFWLKKAIADGADVRGYFYWSLLDNFEWSDGFWPRFGLVAIDYLTQERSIRPSALIYKSIIEKADMRRVGPEGGK